MTSQHQNSKYTINKITCWHHSINIWNTPTVKYRRWHYSIKRSVSCLVKIHPSHHTLLQLMMDMADKKNLLEYTINKITWWHHNIKIKRTKHQWNTHGDVRVSKDLYMLDKNLVENDSLIASYTKPKVCVENHSSFSKIEIREFDKKILKRISVQLLLRMNWNTFETCGCG